jgi:hypothetical protein
VLGKQLDKPLVGLERIFLDRNRVGIVRGELAQHALGNRALALRRNRRRGRSIGRARNRNARRWCHRLPREQRHVNQQAHGGPRRLLPSRRLIYLKARRLEDLVEGQSGLAQQRHQRLGVEAILGSALGRYLIGRRSERDHRARGRLHDGKARRHCARGTTPIAVVARGVENKDTGRCRQGRERVDEIVEPERLRRQIGGTFDLHVDGNQKILACRLRGLAGIVEECDRVWPCGCDLVKKAAQRQPDVGLADIAQFGHVVPSSAHRFGDDSGVVGGCCQLPARIGAVTDDQRYMGLGLDRRKRR